MDDLPQPKPAQLGPRDVYVMPSAAEGFAGIVVAHGRLPVRLHFSLADGTELHLPISDIALRQLSSALAALRPTQERIPGHRDPHRNGFRPVETPATDALVLRPK